MSQGRRRFSEMNPVRVGTIGLLVAVGLLGASLGVGRIVAALTATTYVAEFEQAGGLETGDDVRISGLDVGTVGRMDLEDEVVAVHFDTEGETIQSTTRAAIKTASPLGERYLSLQPSGPETLEPGARIPLERTDSPYSLVEVLEDLTTTTGQIDDEQLADSFDTIASTFSGTPEELDGALAGLSELSETITSRDQELRELLDRAEGVSGILADRSGRINQLFLDGNALFAELIDRRETIRRLLASTERLATQLSGLVADNRESIGPILDEVDGVTEILLDREDELVNTLRSIGPYARSLGESVGGGTFYSSFVVNLTGTNLSPAPSLLEEIDAARAEGGR